VALVLAVGGALYLWSREREPAPPSPEVVATYDGGQITVEDVRQHLALLAPNEASRHQAHTGEDYQHLIYEMIGDELVRRWATGRKPEGEEDFRHVMRHLNEKMDLSRLADRIHEGSMGVTEEDVGAYYEANRGTFGNQTLTEARDQIRATLQAQREREFELEYEAGLKERAAIRRDLSLLEVPEPTRNEMEAFYRANSDIFIAPAKAVVDEIAIAGREGGPGVQEQAEKALAKVRSGAGFAAAAENTTEAAFASGLAVEKGRNPPAYDRAVFSLDPGQVSEVFEAGGTFYVVRLRSLEPERTLSFGEVRDLVYRSVMAEKEQNWFRDRSDQTLLTIDDRRFTVGQFWEEYQELPSDFRARYQGPEGRKKLLENLIERWLLLQDSRRIAGTQEEDARASHVRLKVLSKMMEQEEVDDKIRITDADLRSFYEENREKVVEPPKAKLRYILVRLGKTSDERERARNKAARAYEALTQKGVDFPSVARRFSEDQATARKGGEAGWIGEGVNAAAEARQHPLHEKIFGMRKGEISEPFESGSEIYIFQVLERIEARSVSFEKARSTLEKQLRAKRHMEAADQLFKERMEGARVVVYGQVLEALAREQAQETRP
jgi:parvulin-like peptidyl-prolyl isomerase